MSARTRRRTPSRPASSRPCLPSRASRMGSPAGRSRRLRWWRSDTSRRSSRSRTRASVPSWEKRGRSVSQSRSCARSLPSGSIPLIETSWPARRRRASGARTRSAQPDPERRPWDGGPLRSSPAAGRWHRSARSRRLTGSRPPATTRGHRRGRGTGGARWRGDRGGRRGGSEPPHAATPMAVDASATAQGARPRRVRSSTSGPPLSGTVGRRPRVYDRYVRREAENLPIFGPGRLPGRSVARRRRPQVAGGQYPGSGSSRPSPQTSGPQKNGLRPRGGQGCRVRAPGVQRRPQPARRSRRTRSSAGTASRPRGRSAPASAWRRRHRCSPRRSGRSRRRR